MRYTWALFFVLIFPGFALAKSPMIFPVLPTDLSLQFIYFIFGPITDVAPALMQANSITFVMHIFIGAVIYLALAGMALVGFKSVFTGSSEGHLFGERIPSLEGPVKMGMAILALIPDKYGFCAVQYFVMWFILNGVGLANHLWVVIINNYALGNSLTSDKIILSSSRTEDVAKSLMYAALATAYVESQMTNESLVPKAVAINGSGLPVYLCNLETIGSALCDQNTGIVEYPIKDPGSKSISSTSTLTSSSLAIILQNIMADMIQDPLIEYALATGLNAQALSMDSVELFFGKDYCTFLLSQYSRRLQADLEPFTQKPADTQASINDMMAQGWMSAAYYYWDLYGGNTAPSGAEAILNDLAPTSSSLVRNSIYGYSLGTASANPYYNSFVASQPAIVGYIDTLYAIKNQSPSSSRSYNSIVTDSSSYGVDQMFAMTGTNMLLSAFLSSDMDFYHLDYNFTVDRYSAFIKSNYSVVTNVISFMQGLLMFLFVLALLSVFSGVSPIFFSIMFGLMSGFFLLLPFLSAIATTGVMGSVYAAALPGLIFGAAAFSWFAKVIEAIVAAPLVAMMLVFPNEDSERKLEHVIMQLLVLALRPSLMILGFAISTKLCQLSIMFIGGAFNQLGNSIVSISSDSGGSSSGGVLFLLMMYEFTTMTTLTFISRSFNIINLLPDAVFSAINVSAGNSEADQLISSFEKAADKGAKALSQVVTVMSGMASSMNSLSKKNSSHNMDKSSMKGFQT